MNKEERLRGMKERDALIFAKYGVSQAHVPAYRDAVMKLKHFTPEALAAHLEIHDRKAKNIIRALMELGMVQGLSGGEYERIKPSETSPTHRPRNTSERAGTPISALATRSGSQPVGGTGRTKYPDWIAPYIKKAEQMGFKATVTGSGHIRLGKEGEPPVIMPSTPSDVRSIKNTKADLKRRGIVV